MMLLQLVTILSSYCAFASSFTSWCKTKTTWGVFSFLVASVIPTCLGRPAGH